MKMNCRQPSQNVVPGIRRAGETSPSNHSVERLVARVSHFGGGDGVAG